MSDGTPSITRACKDCGELFERWSGASREGSSTCRCNPCYNSYARTRPSYVAARAGIVLDKATRIPKPKHRECVACGHPCGVVEIPRHAHRRRCTECARLHNIEKITSLYWIAAANVEVRKAQKWRTEIVAHLRQRDGDKCGLCSKAMKFDVPTGPRGDPFGATIDHVIPRSLGGVDDLVNLQLAHWVCNNRKGNRGEAQQLRLVG